MNRRNFLTYTALIGGSAFSQGCTTSKLANNLNLGKQKGVAQEMRADTIIVGGGLGGFAAALACCRNGLSVIMTEETDWIGGQVSQQGVPPDEHQWIETHGAPQSYRDYRNRVRNYYQNNYPLTQEALKRKNLNPGDGSVSRICHEPKVAVAVLTEMLAPYLSNNKLQILLYHKARSSEVRSDKVLSIEVENLLSGDRESIIKRLV